MRVDTRKSAANAKSEAKARYRQFLKLAVERKQVWGLYRDGWALSRDDDEQVTFPLWPERERAALCATGPWQGYEPAEIPLDDLLEQLLPQLARDQVKPCLSPGPNDPGTTPPMAQLILDLEHELDPSAADDDV
jgi:hypothetical protein